MIDLLSIPLYAVADRVRGSGFPGNNAVGIAGFTASLQLIFQLPMTVDTLIFFACVVLAYRLGEAPGWGSFFGAYIGGKPMDPSDLEWWQKGELKTNTQLAMLARGAMWAVPMSAVCVAFGMYQLALFLLIAFTPSFNVSLKLAVDHYKKTVHIDGDPAWRLSEVIRGGFVMLVLVILQRVV